MKTAVELLCIILGILVVILAAILAFVLVRSNGRQSDEEEKQDDVSEDVLHLLSALDCESIVVDKSDDVVRATPAAFRLALVRNDAIADDELRGRILDVRRTGRACTFSLTTSSVPEAEANDDGAAATGRPNWLSVTVVPLNEQLTVVLVKDESSRHRFAQLQDDFVHSVSAQLQEPAQSIEKLGENLNANPDLPDDTRTQAGEVASQAAYLRHLTDDLVLLLKAQDMADSAESDTLDMREVARSIAGSEQDKAREAQVTLDLTCPDAPVNVRGDSQQLSAALGKLVENAIDYSPAGSRVRITVGADEGHAVVRVIDNGPGIARSEQSRIFQRFYKGSQKGRADGGANRTGLGLAIAKHVALAHHGTVRVWSSPGSGSTFSLVIPLAGEESENRPPATTSPASSQRPSDD